MVLFLITQAAAQQGDYTIFNTVLVQGMLNFKWTSYGAVIFSFKTLIFCLQLLIASLFSYFGVRTITLPLADLPRSARGVIVLFTCPLAAGGSLLMLLYNIKQLVLDGCACALSRRTAASRLTDTSLRASRTAGAHSFSASPGSRSSCSPTRA